MEVRLADGNGAGTGDLLRARENSPAIDAAGRPLTNRDTLRLDGTTLAAGGRVALARRQLPDGSWSRQFPVPLDYLRRSAELAYAGNVYVSQGRTVDTSHVYVSPSLSREAFYVAMTRGRSANTAHVVTGPSPARGQEPMAQADPLAVLAEVLDRTSSATTATEAMREAQAFATHSGHLLTMWSAAVRAEAYAAVDRAVQERLSPAEWARYQAEPQRPVFQRLVLGAVLAGAELGAVVDDATGRDFTAARSVSAVMHGRLEAAGYRMGQPESQTARGAPEPAAASGRRGARGPGARPRAPRAGDLGGPGPRGDPSRGPPARPGAGGALDARAEELADAQAERAGALGPADARRVPGRGLRRAPGGLAGPRRPGGGVPARPPGSPTRARPTGQRPRDTPSWPPGPRPDASVTWRSGTAQTDRACPRAELEAHVAAYERVQATAPREVSAELRAERLAEADARARALELRAQGQPELAAQAEARADAGNVRATELEGQAEVYAAWEESTARPARGRPSWRPGRAGAPSGPGSGGREPSEPEAAAPGPRSPPQVTGHSGTGGVRRLLRARGRGGRTWTWRPWRGDLDAAVDQLPELDTTTVSPATEARHGRAGRAPGGPGRGRAGRGPAGGQPRGVRGGRAGRPGAEAESPSAWVHGPATPEWGGPQASTPEAEAAEPEAGL